MEQTMVQMTKEAVENGINSNDAEIIRLAMSGEIEYVDEVPTDPQEPTVPTEPVEPTEPVAPVIPTEPVTPVEPVVPTEPVVEVPDEDNVYLEMVKKAEEKTATLQTELASKGTELQAEMERLRSEHKAEIDELRASISTPAPSAPQKLEEDTDDIELASNYSKNNRSDIENLKETIASLGTGVNSEALNAILDRVGKIEEANKTSEEERVNDKKRTDKEERQIKMFKSIDTFSADKEHLKLSKTTEEEYKEHTALRGRITEYMRTDDDAIVNKTLRGITANETPFYQGLRKKMEDVGITIPEDTSNYLKLSDIVDLKMGVKYDPQTGGYNKILDDLGRQVCQRTIEDAYKLSNYSGNMDKARRDQSLLIQEQLNSKSDSAISIPPENLAQGNESDTMTQEQMNSILDMDARVIRRNPELMAKYNKIMEFLDKK